MPLAKKRHLYIIGSGISGVPDMTQRAMQALGICERIFSVGHIDGLSTLASTKDWKHEDVSGLYVNGALDHENYGRIKKKVLNSFLENSIIGLVVPGHPRVGVTIVNELSALADEEIELSVLPGLSSFDTMINDLSLDPLEEGTALVDANRLLLYGYDIEPALNLFVYHVCSIGTEATNFSDPKIGNKLGFLKEKLLSHYPGAQKIYLIRSADGGVAETTVHETTINGIESILDHVTFSSTLYIPATLPRKARINKPFLKALTEA